MKLKLVTAIILCTALCFVLCSCNIITTEEYTDSISFSDFDELDIDMLSENVTLNVWDKDENTVNYNIICNGLRFSEAKISVKQTDKKVNIESDYGVTLFGSIQANVDIFISKKSFSKLSVDMTSGHFEVADDNGLTLDDLSINMTSGNTDISGVTVNECSIDITSGNVKINGAINKCEADLTSGDVDVTTSIFPQKLSGDITSGTLSCTMPESKDGFTMDYDITSGNINCDFAVKGFTSKEGRATYAAGKSAFKFDLTSGVVNINKLN